MAENNPQDPFDGFEITDEWAAGAKKQEQTAQERADIYAKVNRGNRAQEAAAKEELTSAGRKSRLNWRKVWPWVAFVVICALLIGLSYV